MLFFRLVYAYKPKLRCIQLSIYTCICCILHCTCVLYMTRLFAGHDYHHLTMTLMYSWVVCGVRITVRKCLASFRIAVQKC